MNKDWWTRRWEAFLDNLIFYLAVIAGGALVALAAAFGTEDATLPLWLVVLFGAVQITTIVAVVVQFRRASTPAATESQPGAPPPHPHEALLARIDALLESVRNRKMEGAIPWTIASSFNRILGEAKEATHDPALDDIEAYVRGDQSESYAYSGYMDGLEASLAQIRVVVQHARE